MCEITKEKLAEHDDGNKRLIRYCMTDDEIQLFSLMFNLRNASYAVESLMGLLHDNLRNASYAVESLMGLLHDSYVYRQFEGHRGDYKDCPAEICRSFRNMVAEWNKAVR